MITLAISSQKGGVGKTTTSVNLAYALAKRGWHTLLVDTDPQGSVGLSLSEKARHCPGFFDAVNHGKSVVPMVLPTRMPELEVLTAGQVHSFFQATADEVEVEAAIRRVIRDLAERRHDIVIIDTPAGLTGITGHLLRASDFVLVPQQAEPLGLRSLPHMLEGIRQLRKAGSRVELAGVLLTMTQPDLPECRAVMQEIRTLLPGKIVLQTTVPRDPVYIKASSAGVPVSLISRHPTAAALVFDQLAAELELRLRMIIPNSSTTNEHTKLMD